MREQDFLGQVAAAFGAAGMVPTPQHDTNGNVTSFL
jgi:hypothetical protein